MQTIGERLEEARKRKGISIREAADATKVRSEYLHKFESSQFDINLPEIYTRGFLRAYAAYLGLPGEKIIADYNALGLKKSKKSLNREIYGKLDISVSRKEAAANSGFEAEAENPSRTTAEAKDDNPATFVPPGTGPYIDKSLLIKGGVLAASLVVAVVLVIWVVGLFGNDAKTPGETANASQAAANEPMISLVALDTVTVKLVQASDNLELFQGQMKRGDVRTFPRRGKLFLTATALENVEIEVGGKRYATGQTGYDRIAIDG